MGSWVTLKNFLIKTFSRKPGSLSPKKEAIQKMNLEVRLNQIMNPLLLLSNLKHGTITKYLDELELAKRRSSPKKAATKLSVKNPSNCYHYPKKDQTQQKISTLEV